MRIHEKTLRHWALFGYRLGRMNFLWDRAIPETREAFYPALEELQETIGNEFEPKYDSYSKFCNSILSYYADKDTEIVSCILIGICAQRYQLSLALHNPDRQKEYRELARSVLDAISSETVPDKDFLFSAIVMSKDAAFFALCNKIMDALNAMYDDNGNPEPSSENRAIESFTNRYMFISYSSKDAESAKIVKGYLEKNGINAWIAPDSIPIGSEYTQVIVDAIEKSSGVILILSGNSQNSPWVPKELDIAITSEKVIFPIRIDDAVLNNKMRFRLSNSQITDAMGQLEKKLPVIIEAIKSSVPDFEQ